jgi:hypothetical protein
VKAATNIVLEKKWQYLDNLRDYQFLKKDSALFAGREKYCNGFDQRFAKQQLCKHE